VRRRDQPLTPCRLRWLPSPGLRGTARARPRHSLSHEPRNCLSAFGSMPAVYGGAWPAGRLAPSSRPCEGAASWDCMRSGVSSRPGGPWTSPPAERCWLAKLSPSCGNQRIEGAFGRPGPARLQPDPAERPGASAWAPLLQPAGPPLAPRGQIITSPRRRLWPLRDEPLRARDQPRRALRSPSGASGGQPGRDLRFGRA
jgi:hypothetical protein